MRNFPCLRAKIPAIPAVQEASAGAGFAHVIANVPANSGGICCKGLVVSCQVNIETCATLLREGLKVHAVWIE